MVRCFVLAAMLTLSGLPAEASPIELTFLPPEVAPQPLCLRGLEDTGFEDDAGIDNAELTDTVRLRFLNRDIRRLQAEDPDRWFDFLIDLIDWKAELDAGFDQWDVLLAKIDLHIDAGRLEELKAAAMIDQLRAAQGQLNGAQKMRLAQFYLNGIGVAQDIPYAHALIVEAAFAGNPEALLAIARIETEEGKVAGWDAPLDLTVTLAFTGLLGQMDEKVCRNAERIAQFYLAGDIVARNPQVAFAWTKFAADLGGAEAAWRIVEFHLAAEAVAKDNVELLKYLRLAVERGVSLKGVQIDALERDPDLETAEIQRILGFNYSRDDGSGLRRLEPYLILNSNLSDDDVTPESPWMLYLKEVTRFDTAPGFVFTDLGEEILARVGRWAGEQEAIPYLEQAALRGDSRGMRTLAEILIRYRWDATRLNRAENLLLEAATRWGDPLAMRDLDNLYRCQSPGSPYTPQASLWLSNYAATEFQTVGVTPPDLVGLDPFMDPETLAMAQAQAMADRFESVARFAVRLQRETWATDNALRLWAARLSRSENALEDFALFEYTLAASPRDRDLGAELMRRAYLNNGPMTALEMAIVLTEYDGRDRVVAREILDLLRRAANRGEGGAIRLIARHERRIRSENDAYTDHAQDIEERGDFLALMTAIRYVPTDVARDYIDRAVAVMSCSTKDIEELADAATFLGDQDQVLHWKNIGLTLAYEHTLSKLAISDRQMDFYSRGAAPDAAEVMAREMAEGNVNARRELYALTANPDLPTYDPKLAAETLIGALDGASTDDEAWIMQSFRQAPDAVRDIIEPRFDMRGLYTRAAGRGDVVARRELGILLRDTGQSAVDLQQARDWLTEAAEGGDVIAMRALGQMLALGLAGPPDRAAARGWLEQAARAGDAEAVALVQLLSSGAP